MTKVIWGVLITTLLGAGIWFMLSLNNSAVAGASLGKLRDQASCVREVTRGSHVCLEKSCFLNNRYYFRACMDSARRSPSLCSGVRTNFGNLMAFEMWKKKQCDSLNRTDRGCHHIWQRVAQACDT